MMYEEVVRDFAIRTRKNLEEIESLKTQKKEVYEVTQLINSMLGLLVFPQQKFVDSIPCTPLSELQMDGWPIPRITGDFSQVEDLNQLIRYLRNAVAHFNIKFLGDGENGIKVLKVWNMAAIRNEKGQVVRDNGKVMERKNWEAELTVAELRTIANKFIELLLDSLTPSSDRK